MAQAQFLLWGNVLPLSSTSLEYAPFLDHVKRYVCKERGEGGWCSSGSKGEGPSRSRLSAAPPSPAWHWPTAYCCLALAGSLEHAGHVSSGRPSPASQTPVPSTRPPRRRFVHLGILRQLTPADCEYLAAKAGFVRVDGTVRRKPSSSEFSTFNLWLDG